MVGWCAGCEFSEANYILEEAPSLAQFITRDSRVCCRWWKTANADGSKCGWQCCQVHKRGQHLYQSLSRETRLSNGSFDARVPSCTGRASPLHQGWGVVSAHLFCSGILVVSFDQSCGVQKTFCETRDENHHQCLFVCDDECYVELFKVLLVELCAMGGRFGTLVWVSILKTFQSFSTSFCKQTQPPLGTMVVQALVWQFARGM